MTDLLNLFNELDRVVDAPKSKDDVIIRAPFGYPGGKTKSSANIIKHLPYREKYIEPFGGSGAILLARKPVRLEVLNDKYSGVVSFYRCLRDPIKYRKMVEWLELSVHSREDFKNAKDTWCTETDDVIRAAKWYYMINYSFGSIGRNFGRSTSGRGLIAGKIRNKLKRFPYIHERLKFVQIENQSWQSCLTDYDSHDAVFYIDPPYLDAHAGTYSCKMDKDEHGELLQAIFSLKGFVAVSGYSNPLYESQNWDNRHSWDSFVTIEPMAFTESNYKKLYENVKKREAAEEILWIKEAR